MHRSVLNGVGLPDPLTLGILAPRELRAQEVETHLRDDSSSPTKCID